jgi:hypothetical protein
LRKVFGDRTIRNGLWSRSSPDLSLCDFHLWRTVKQKGYRSSPHTVLDIKENIQREVFHFPRGTECVTANVLWRSQKCFQNK